MAMTDTEVEEQAQPEDTGPAQPALDLPDAWPKGTDHKYIGSLYVAAAEAQGYRPRWVLMGTAMASDATTQVDPHSSANWMIDFVSSSMKPAPRKKKCQEKVTAVPHTTPRTATTDTTSTDTTSTDNDN